MKQKFRMPLQRRWSGAMAMSSTTPAASPTRITASWSSPPLFWKLERFPKILCIFAPKKRWSAYLWNEQSKNYSHSPDGLWGLDGKIREPDWAHLRCQGGPAMDFHRRPAARRNVSGGMVVHAWVRGVAGPRQRQLLRRMDEEPHECHDQLQRRLPSIQFLYRSDERLIQIRFD